MPTGVPAGEMRSIPWCVCPTRGQPNESANEFGPATRHTWIGEFGSECLAQDLELLLLRLVLLGESADEVVDPGERVLDPLVRRLQARRLLLLTGLEADQLVALADQLFLGHVQLDDDVRVRLAHAAENSSLAEKSANDSDDSSRSIVLPAPAWKATTARRSTRRSIRSTLSAATRCCAPVTSTSCRVASRSRSAACHAVAVESWSWIRARSRLADSSCSFVPATAGNVRAEATTRPGHQGQGEGGRAGPARSGRSASFGRRRRVTGRSRGYQSPRDLDKRARCPGTGLPFIAAMRMSATSGRENSIRWALARAQHLAHPRARATHAPPPRAGTSSGWPCPRRSRTRRNARTSAA